MANLTWLQDANYAATSGYSGLTFGTNGNGYYRIWGAIDSPSDNTVDGYYGMMTWDQAQIWVKSLNIGGVTGWRLPSGPTGINSQTGELSNLFYNVLDGRVQSVSGTVLSNNPNPFKIPSNYYWTNKTLSDGAAAWAFNFGYGGANYEFIVRPNGLFAWAVQSGDVGASPVPLPGALVLIAPALLGCLRRRAA